MQPFNVLSPASHTAPTRDNRVNFAGEQPARNGEDFGDVMDRALTNKPWELNGNDDAEKAIEKFSRQNEASPTSTQRPEDTSKSRKAPRRDLSKDNLESSQSAKENVGGTPLPQPIEKAAEDQIALDDEGTSDAPNAAGSGTEKGQHATNSSSDKASATSLQFLTLAGISLPVPSASASNNQGKARVSGEAKANANTVAGGPVKSGTSSTSTADTADSKEGGSHFPPHVPVQLRKSLAAKPRKAQRAFWSDLKKSPRPQTTAWARKMRYGPQ